jgi:hypothetical protein
MEEISLSIVIPVACSPDQLKFTISRFIEINKLFFNEVPCEVLAMDSKDHPENERACAQLRERFKETGTVFSYETTEFEGCHIKFREGLLRAQGEYAFFLVDEIISMYDFLDDLFEIARLGDFAPMPYMVTHLPSQGTEEWFNRANHILGFSKQIPVMGATFAMARRNIFIELTENTPNHSLGGHHWMLNLWEKGLVPVYDSRHLKYIPVLQYSVEKPASYETSKMLDPVKDRLTFVNNWPVERIEKCWEIMVEKCQSILADAKSSLKVIKSPRGGVFFAKISDKVPLPEIYTVLESAEEVRTECEMEFEKWRIRGIPILDSYQKQIPKRRKPLYLKVARKLKRLARLNWEEIRPK